MSVPFKKDPDVYDHRSLFATNIFDLLPSDHPCYIYEDIFQHLDTSSIEENYSTLGQHAYHPRLITGILIYAYSQGVFSSREIEKKCHEDLGFMFTLTLHKFLSFFEIKVRPPFGVYQGNATTHRGQPR